MKRGNIVREWNGEEESEGRRVKGGDGDDGEDKKMEIEWRKEVNIRMNRNGMIKTVLRGD